MLFEPQEIELLKIKFVGCAGVAMKNQYGSNENIKAAVIEVLDNESQTSPSESNKVTAKALIEKFKTMDSDAVASFFSGFHVDEI